MYRSKAKMNQPQKMYRSQPKCTEFSQKWTEFSQKWTEFSQK
jgi:hypothetical protein